MSPPHTTDPPSEPPPVPAMRRLSSCGECRAQYDTSELAVGARFRCACGGLVEVAAERSHEAAVVRCSSCGGPRQGGAAACGFCGSDFTVHERDLHTICPGCAARISDRARFCHGCGIAISPVATASRATEHRCPTCVEEHRLNTRELGGPDLTVFECPRCAGLWLGSEAFRLIEQRARQLQGSALANVPAAPEGAQAATTSAATRAYRPCPICGKLMHRRNYGRRSGVIVDQCTADGLWFDRGELERILRWIHDGGLTRAEELDALKRREETRARAAGPPVGSLFESEPSSRGTGRLLGSLVDFLSLFD